ncbi:hypothetical protein [Aestuariivirga sp.]
MAKFPVVVTDPGPDTVMCVSETTGAVPGSLLMAMAAGSVVTRSVLSV